MKVNLEDVVNAIESRSSGYTYYYITSEERIIPLADSDLRNLDYDENEMIRLPDRDDVDDYGNMERFIAKVEDETIQEWLSNAIKGRGAFRMFRGALERFHMLNEWYDYRDRAHRICAMDWCEENGIEYEGSRYVIEDDYDDDYEDEDDDYTEEPVITAPKKPVTPDYKIIAIGKRNVGQLVFLASAFTDERLIKKGYKKADDPDAANERLEENLAEGRVIHALSDHGRFVGYVIAEEAANRYLLKEIYVKPELRRKGLGRKLVQQAEADAQQAGRAVAFDIAADDQDTIAFMRKCGYTVLRTLHIEKDDGNHEDISVEIDGVPFYVR